MTRFYVGSYSIPSEWTEAPYGHGEGVSVKHLGEHTVETLFPPTFEINPSFTVAESDASRLWAVTEPEFGGELICYDVAKDGSLSSSPVARVVTGSNAPCHLELADEFVLVSHFHGGTVSVILRGEDGLPLHVIDSITPPDSADGRDLSELRPRPHAAIMLPSGTEFAVADYGRDTVSLYGWDSEHMTVALLAVAALPEGSAPRHLAWSSRHNRLFVSLQLSGVAAVLTVTESGGKWSLDVVQTTPAGGLGRAHPIPSEIAIDPTEQFVVMANRVDNSLSVFAVTEEGFLTEFDTVDSRGTTPRYFAITPEGDRLIVAHQESDGLTVFNFAGGKLDYSFTAECATPTSVAFWPL
ncbi:MAG: lactonase family protein [Leucobacter sp.]